MGAFAQALTQALGRTGNEITEAKDLRLEDQAKQLQLLTAKGQLDALKQRLGIEQAELGLEQTREKRMSATEAFEEQQRKLPQYKGWQVVGNKAYALQQMPDGSMKVSSFDVGAGDAQVMMYGQKIIDTIQDPVKKQRMQDGFMAQVSQGKAEDGLKWLQSEVARQESEEQADKRLTQQETFSKQQQGRQEAFSQAQQERGFEHQEKMLDLRAKEKVESVKKNAAQSLSVLQASLFGQGGTPGLKDSLSVLDSKYSRGKLIAAHVGQMANPDSWTVTRLIQAGVYNNMTTPEKVYAQQLSRAVSAIQGLRGITGLPRSTASLMQTYISELPDPVTTPSSKDGMRKLMLVEREIRAALSPDNLAKAVADEDKAMGGMPMDMGTGDTTYNPMGLPPPGEP